MQVTHSEQELVHREKLKELRIVHKPIPCLPLYEITHTAQQIEDGFNEETKDAESK